MFYCCIFSKFNRVLPLPSQTWRDLFNNWSCCSSSYSQGKKTTPGWHTLINGNKFYFIAFTPHLKSEIQSCNYYKLF